MSSSGGARSPRRWPMRCMSSSPSRSCLPTTAAAAAAAAAAVAAASGAAAVAVGRGAPPQGAPALSRTPQRPRRVPRARACSCQGFVSSTRCHERCPSKQPARRSTARARRGARRGAARRRMGRARRRRGTRRTRRVRGGSTRSLPPCQKGTCSEPNRCSPRSSGHSPHLASTRAHWFVI